MSWLRTHKLGAWWERWFRIWWIKFRSCQHFPYLLTPLDSPIFVWCAIVYSQSSQCNARRVFNKYVKVTLTGEAFMVVDWLRAFTFGAYSPRFEFPVFIHDMLPFPTFPDFLLCFSMKKLAKNYKLKSDQYWPWPIIDDPIACFKLAYLIKL